MSNPTPHESNEARLQLWPMDLIEVNDTRITYPITGCALFDGIRVLFTKDGIFDQQNVQFPDFVDDRFSELLAAVKESDCVLEGYLWSPDISYQQMLEALQSSDKVTQLHFHVYDMLSSSEWNDDDGAGQPYIARFEEYTQWVEKQQLDYVYPVDQMMLDNEKMTNQLIEQCVDAGHEGIVLRNPMSLYHHGQVELDDRLVFPFKRPKEGEAAVQKLVNIEGHPFYPDGPGAVVKFTKEGDKTECLLAISNEVQTSPKWKSLQKSPLGVKVQTSFTHFGRKDIPRLGTIQEL